jgi:hypothetical protein
VRLHEIFPRFQNCIPQSEAKYVDYVQIIPFPIGLDDLSKHPNMGIRVNPYTINGVRK